MGGMLAHGVGVPSANDSILVLRPYKHPDYPQSSGKTLLFRRYGIADGLSNGMVVTYSTMLALRVLFCAFFAYCWREISIVYINSYTIHFNMFFFDICILYSVVWFHSCDDKGCNR